MPLKKVFNRHEEMIMEPKKLVKASTKKSGLDWVATSFKSPKLTLVNTRYNANTVKASFNINLEVFQSFCLVIDQRTTYILLEINVQKA